MEKNTPIIVIDKVSRSFGGIQAVNNVSLSVMPQELFSLIGPNGAGKTTLLNCISAFLHPNSGKIIFKDEEITRLKSHKIITRGISRTFQHAELFRHMSVLDNIKT